MPNWKLNFQPNVTIKTYFSFNIIMYRLRKRGGLLPHKVWACRHTRVCVHKLQYKYNAVINQQAFWDHSQTGKINQPLSYPGKSHGRRSLAGCSPRGLRVRLDWATSLSLITVTHWRRKWQPTLVFVPWESQGRGSLVGCHLWGCTESDTTEAT